MGSKIWVEVSEFDQHIKLIVNFWLQCTVLELCAINWLKRKEKSFHTNLHDTFSLSQQNLVNIYKGTNRFQTWCLTLCVWSQCVDIPIWDFLLIKTSLVCNLSSFIIWLEDGPSKWNIFSALLVMQLPHISSYLYLNVNTAKPLHMVCLPRPNSIRRSSLNRAWWN